MLEKKLLGEGIKHSKIDDFIGNYKAISIGDFNIEIETYISNKKPIKKSTHCGLTKEELYVPIIVIEK